MANISKIQVNGTDYDVKDSQARSDIQRVEAAQAADILEDGAGVLHILDSSGNPIGNGAALSAKVDDLIVEQEGDENKLYLSYQGTIIGNGVVLPASGGGGGTTATSVVRLANNNGNNALSVSTGEAAELIFTFTSTENDISTGNGTCKVYVGGALKRTLSISNGVQTVVDVAQYLVAGVNTVKVTCLDIYGNSRSLTYSVTLVELSIESIFDETLTYNGDIPFKYTPYGIGVSKIVHFLIDDEDAGTETTSLSGRQLTKTFTALSHGIHTLEVYATATINEESLESTHLKYEIMSVVAGNNEPMISLNYHSTTAVQGAMVSIPYSIYDPLKLACDITLRIYNQDNAVYSTQEITVDRDRHTWNTRRYPTGNVKFEIAYTSGGYTVTRYKVLAVSESNIDVEAVTNDMELHLVSAGRSNREATPNTWVDGDTSTTFDGVNWASTGWIEDENGDVALRLNGGATAEVNFQLFANDFKQYGKTIEFEFAVRDVNNRGAEIISCMSGDVGISITADKAILKSSMSSVECRFRDEEKIRVGFVVESTSEDRLLLVYLNGILSGAIQYPATDTFSQVSPATISIGSQYCGIDIYAIRSYTTSLSSKEMVGNFIADTTDIVEKTELFEDNSVYTNNQVSYDIMKTKIPTITITGVLPQSKGDKHTVAFKFENPTEPNLNFEDNCQLDVQGTSSQYYIVKNFKAKFSANHTHATGFLPAKVFCLKADYAEATGTHNTQNANLIHTLYSEETPAQEDDARCRTTVYGFPCVLFHQATADDAPVFVGKYNFNYDKGATNVFGFSESYDVESWEFLNNTSDACNFKAEIAADYSDDFEARYPEDHTITRFKTMHDWVVSTNQDAATGDVLAEPYTDVDGTVHAIDDAAYRLAKFKTEFEQYFNMHYCSVYYVYTFFMLMVDQRAKNMFLTYWGGDECKWSPWFYDNDTCLGINNEGQLVFDYYHEDTDVVNGANVYNGQGSVLWSNFRQAFQESIKSCYQALRNGNKLTYDILVDYFLHSGCDKWAASIYNEDGEYKYISMLRNGGDSSYLYQVRGSGEEHFKYFIENRLDYCDSKWYASDYANDIVSLRIYTPATYTGVAPNADITVTPYSNIYVGVKYKANGTLQQTRATKDVAVTFEAPDETFNDTETAIYGASDLSSLGDLAPLYCGTLDVSKANKLLELKVGDGTTGYSNQNLTTLSLGSNKLLKKIDIRNCPNLVAPLDISNCPNMEEVYAQGTGITGVVLPEAGYLKKMYLPSTIVDLTIKNQSALNDLTLAGYSALRTLRIENCSGVDSTAIAYAATNLTNVRITGLALEWNSIDNAFIEHFSGLGGLDEDGLPIDTAVISGTCHITSLTGAQYAQMQAVFPYLTITYDTLSSTITYKSADGSTTLHTETITNGGNASNPVSDGDIATPTKPSTAQYSYTFSGWSRTAGGAADATALNAITADRTVYAAFTSAVRSYTVRFMNGSTVLQTSSVQYGSNATYTGSAPVSSQGVDYEFSGWSPSPENITGATDCVAQFAAPPAALDAYTWAELSELPGTAPSIFAIGDCKSTPLNGTIGTINVNATYYAYIIGFDPNDSRIIFGTFKTAPTGGVSVALCDSHYGTSASDTSKWFNMNHSGTSTNVGGWQGCDMRYDILGSVDVKGAQNAGATTATSPVANTFMAALESDLRAVMKPMTVYTDNTGNANNNNASAVTATVDYLPLLSEYEIFGARSYANTNEALQQTQYAYYASGNSKVKYNHSNTGSTVYWWERSAYYNDANSFCFVNNGGYAGAYGARGSYGVAPAFKV